MPPVKKPKLSYTHDQLLLALEALKNGENAFRVSKRYGIPRSTLIYKASGKLPLNEKRKFGPAPRLGYSAEEMLKKWVMALAVKGFPVTKNDLLTSVQQILKDMNCNNMFPDGRPGPTWLKLFLQRNPQISYRTVEKLSKVRATVTEEKVKNWFREVETYFEKNNLQEVVLEPSRVFNMDESAFFLCPKSDRVLAIKGQKNVYEVSAASEKENLTVLCNVNAAGHIAPTLIVYPGQRLPQALKLNVPNDWIISKSENGWITGQVFYEYFVNYFHKWLIQQNIEFPVVVFLDGHVSHLTYHLSQFCSSNKIVLIALPPNCTHIMQPLDVAVFRPLKRGWVDAVHSWRMTNGGERLTKYSFAPMLKEVMEKTMTEKTIRNGFSRCGLCPFDQNRVDYSKIDVLRAELAPTQTANKTIKPPLTVYPQNVPVTSHSEGQECLSFFESFISPELLVEFETTCAKTLSPFWRGNDCSHDLYVAWKKAKDFVKSKEKLKCDTTVPTNADKPGEKSSVPKNTSKKQNQSKTAKHSSSTAVQPITPMDGVPDEISMPITEAEQTTPEKANNPGPSNATSCNSSATKEKLAKVLSPETDGTSVPSPYKNYLFWPGTPQKSKKQNKRSCTQTHVVVSGKEWQDIEANRRKEKKLEEEQKAERKRIREEKKKSSQKNPKGPKRKLINDEEEDWICKVCKKRFSAEFILGLQKKWINCDTCKCAYHFKCIPKKHRNKYGIEEDDENDDDDEIAFLCHNCVSDSDDDSLVLSEIDEEDFE